MNSKYKIIRILDIAGLRVFEPVVRLLYRDNPEEQSKKIFLFLITPILAFVFFLAVWNYIAPRHTTKSGQVPTPPVVWDAWKGILNFHDREYTKMDDFELKGKDREAAIEYVETRLKDLEPVSVAAKSELTKKEQEYEERMNTLTAPIIEKYNAKKTEFKTAQKERKAALVAKGMELKAGDKAAKDEYITLVSQDIERYEKERDLLKEIKSEEDDIRSQKWLPLEEAQKNSNEVAEQIQYLKKRLEFLGDANKYNKIDTNMDSLNESKEEFYALAGSDALYNKAKSIVRSEKRISKILSSEYAKPYTFLDQIWISVKCVFLGFVIATFIAVPIGIICGLSSVMMAMLTPLISLFKPVSPIVWLPIVFIIVGGFISDPDNAVVQPAFLSSAITVALCSLWPTLVNTALGVSSIEKDHMNVAKVLKLGFFSRLIKIVIPSALPFIFTGLRISLGVGWMVLIAAELLSSSEGIGKFVWDMFNNGSSQTFAQMFVVVFVVGIVGLMLDRIMIVLQKTASYDGAKTSL